MNERFAMLAALLGVVGVGVVRARRAARAAPLPQVVERGSAPLPEPSLLERVAGAGQDAAREVVEAVSGVIGFIGAWSPPSAAAAFARWFGAARERYRLPSLLLERVAHQESRFRPDIIDGRTVSSAGALGLMQIVPRWHPGVDPLNPAASIDYAGGYLRRLRDRFGSWRLALAAYNWGEGNVSKALRDGRTFASWPTETRNYVEQIAADVPDVAAEGRLA